MMTEYEISIKPEVINSAYRPYLDNMARVQIYYGGSSSGKSVFLAQRDVLDVLKGGRNFLVVRQVGKTLRGSVVQEIGKVIKAWGLLDLFSINKTDGTVTCKNGYQIVFAGLDDVEKLKSLTPAKGVFTDIRIEEATETDRNTVKQLLKRQRGGDESTAKRLVMSFNPILQSHWVYAEYFEGVGWTDGQREYRGDGLTILKTTYKDNRFLTTEDRHDLENETDKYFYNVYTLGNWGVLGNVIFTNWRVEDLTAMADQFTNRRHGLDFGFADDPAAMPCTHFDRMRKTIYVYNELYEKGLTNPELAARLKPMVGKDPVTADSAEPKSIAELSRDKDNPINVTAARKGKDSVVFGVQWLQQQALVIDPRCVNMIREAQSYKWKEDGNGNALPVPVDKFNHLWDAMRYAYENDAERTEVKVIDDPFSGW
jgi:phage terminase large subunit